ncbi:hypothetical protein GN958_ATG12823, partial [Phytophthora infestans]
PTPSEALLDSDTGTLPPDDSPTEDADGDPAGRQPDPSSSEAPSDSSSGNSSDPKAQSNLPAIKSFADTKREKERRIALLLAKAKQARAKLRAAKKRAARKPSSRDRHCMERKTRCFLISTMDDAHVLLVEGYTSAYAIDQKWRDRYEASSVHGDPYYINHYLMTINSWKPDLAIWKGSKKFIPYTDLKATANNIERPESRVTYNETALKTVHNVPDGRDDPAPPANVCTYCQRPNHAIRDCRRAAEALAHSYCERSDDRQRPSGRPDQGSQPWKAPEMYDRFDNPVNYQDLQRNYNSRGREVGLITYATILMPDVGLSATPSDPHDPTWTVDSGCTRHAAYQESWFKEIRQYDGAIMVGGKQQLPIRGIGDIILEVVDSEGTTRQLEFCDVLFVPDMKLNLLSFAQQGLQTSS